MAALAAAGDTGALSADLGNQLASLAALRANITVADGHSLLQLRADVTATVAAAGDAVKLAQGAVDKSAGSPTGAMAYQQATAALDARMTVLRDADTKRNDLAHDMAHKYGVSLTDYDDEREKLERERLEAIARDDKIAERQADTLLLDNTKNSMGAVSTAITDPAERKRFEEEQRQAERDAAEGRAILAQQLELDGKRRAAEQGLTGKEAESFVTNFQTTKLAETDQRADNLQFPKREQAEMSVLGAANRAVASEQPLPPVSTIHEALAPEVREATQKAAAAISNSFEAFKTGLSLDLSSSIALSSAPDAHTTVEVPSTSKVTTPGQRSQSLA